LLDIILPDVNGYDVFKQLKQAPETTDIPVIFITGLGDSWDEEKGLDMGAADYIGKPFSDTIVKLRVRNQIKIVNVMRTLAQLRAEQGVN
jgi:PleD family two-component response regulator